MLRLTVGNKWTPFFVIAIPMLRLALFRAVLCYVTRGTMLTVFTVQGNLLLQKAQRLIDVSLVGEHASKCLAEQELMQRICF